MASVVVSGDALGVQLRIYRPEPNAPWGDYGIILAHGMGMYVNDEGRLPLERTGPFVPPVTMPWPLVVTADMRGTLERAGLTGLAFVPVHKERIVRYAWEHWDRETSKPAEYPPEGEPEEYILSRPHDEELARSMPDLFMIAPTGRAELVKHEVPQELPEKQWIEIPVPTGK